MIHRSISIENNISILLLFIFVFNFGLYSASCLVITRKTFPHSDLQVYRSIRSPGGFLSVHIHLITTITLVNCLFTFYFCSQKYKNLVSILSKKQGYTILCYSVIYFYIRIFLLFLLSIYSLYSLIFLHLPQKLSYLFFWQLR